MTSQEITEQLAQSGEHDYVERLNALALSKTAGGLIKNSDSEVRWKTMRLNVADVSDQGIIDGMASGYLNLDSDQEVCLPGCFDNSLSPQHNPHPVVLWQHMVTTPIGFHMGPGSGDAAKGLPIKAELMLDCEPGRYALAFARAAKRHGAKAGLSVGFRIIKDKPIDGGDVRGGTRGKQYRGFVECSLLEYSLVTFPANAEAFVTDVKSQFDEAIRKTAYSIPLIPNQDTQPKEPPVADNKNKEAASGLLTFEAALTQGKSDEPERLRIENALHAAMASILDSGLSKGEIKVLVHKCQHCYADSISDWMAKQMDACECFLAGVEAIKGMSTASHMEIQGKLSKAEVHLNEAQAADESANQHKRRALKYQKEAHAAYSAADIQAPNGPASGANAKKSDEQEQTTKADATVLDFSALLGALTVK
jgi:HK97 family phage prohead protease